MYFVESSFLHFSIAVNPFTVAFYGVIPSSSYGFLHRCKPFHGRLLWRYPFFELWLPPPPPPLASLLLINASSPPLNLLHVLLLLHLSISPVDLFLCFPIPFDPQRATPGLPRFVAVLIGLVTPVTRLLTPWLTSIRCRVNRSGNSGYAPLNSNSNFSDRPPTEMAPLFPGCDYEHWLIVMDKPGGEGASKQQMIDCYVQTLAKVLGSEEEAKKKIYNVSCERYFGFGCEIDEETSNKLEGLPGVLFVLPDSYVDPEYKDYGAELFVNGEIVQRSPERQKRVEPQPQRAQDRPRYNDRTRYVRRRENMR
ncbi:multiple organellar RNA editing factor 2, chloroplastic-like [Cucurbita maxima]|uniref:Multiple organellar RNA editing factor 2, chloroplastic-like n=1 Tax=Cucurbita maxima TaxID=3661 RepID=A0A6J1IGF8_CUCMA|nr:multiple organellar RNA editing factor 2, chloroplastic-like [Cucurbita maxima]